MQHFMVRLLIRNKLHEKVWNLVVPSTTCVKNDGYVKFSGFCTYPSSQFVGRTRSFEVELVAKNIRAGRTVEETLSALLQDEFCEAITVSHDFVDTLLHRYRDDWKAAFGVFRWAESRYNYKQLPEACDLMVDILGKAREFSKMRKLVSEMRETNLVSLNTVAKMMRRFAGARQWNDAVRTFDELSTFGLEKNTESLNVLVDTLCKENQVEMARTIFLKLKSHVPPNLHTFNVFIHGWCKIKRVEEADWTLQEMKGHGFTPGVISHSIIIKSYCHMHNWTKVYELLDVMKAEGCQPSIITYTTIMGSLTKAGEFEDALKIGDVVKSSGCKADTRFYNALIYAVGKARGVREAFDVFKMEMPKNGVPPNTETHNTLIAMFCYHGQEEMAFNILKEMEKSAVCKPDLQTFDPLLKACLKLQMTHDLSKLLDDMVTKHHLSLDVSTYTLLVHGLCRIGKCKWAFRLFEDMIDKGVILRYQTCKLLLDAVKENSMTAAAEKIGNYMKHMRDSKQNFPGSPGTRLPRVPIEE